jgi:hypothetical protein
MISSCNVQFGVIARYGKKSTLLGFSKRPQDVVTELSLLQPCLP